MLTLFFEGMSSNLSFRTAPAAEYRIDGEQITDSNGQTIAIRQDGFWSARENHYTRIECDGPLHVLFEGTGTDTSELIGPIEKLIIISGMILSGKEYIAVLDKDAKWRHYQTRKPWSAILLSEV